PPGPTAMETIRSLRVFGLTDATSNSSVLPIMISALPIANNGTNHFQTRIAVPRMSDYLQEVPKSKVSRRENSCGSVHERREKSCDSCSSKARNASSSALQRPIGLYVTATIQRSFRHYG